MLRAIFFSQGGIAGSAAQARLASSPGENMHMGVDLAGEKRAELFMEAGNGGEVGRERQWGERRRKAEESELPMRSGPSQPEQSLRLLALVKVSLDLLIDRGGSSRRGQLALRGSESRENG